MRRAEWREGFKQIEGNVFQAEGAVKKKGDGASGKEPDVGEDQDMVTEQ